MPGGTDTLTVGDLSGTDVRTVGVDLAGSIGGTTGDGAADVVIATGTNARDVIEVTGAGTALSVSGLAARIDVTKAEGANDSLVINALGGNDEIVATTLPAGVMKLTLDGGAGNDRIFGSQGADVMPGRLIDCREDIARPADGLLPEQGPAMHVEDDGRLIRWGAATPGLHVLGRAAGCLRPDIRLFADTVRQIYRAATRLDALRADVSSRSRA